MTKETWSRLLRRPEVVCLVAVMLIAVAVPMKAQAAEIKRVEEIDFMDFSNWRSGVYYHTNGKYMENRYRICLNDYVTFSSDKYKAQITDSSFRILVRELNAAKSFLRTVTLSNGQEYEPGSNTVYLAISIYKAVGSEGSMSYETYESKFANGFTAKLCVVKN